jgi:hypothetical protein
VLEWDGIALEREYALAVLVLVINEMDCRRGTGTQIRSHGGKLIQLRFARGVERGIASQCDQPFSFIPGRCEGAVFGVQGVLLGYPWH